MHRLPRKDSAYQPSSPLRQRVDDLQRRQMRSPAQVLGNGVLHIRHFLIFSEVT